MHINIGLRIHSPFFTGVNWRHSNFSQKVGVCANKKACLQFYNMAINLHILFTICSNIKQKQAKG